MRTVYLDYNATTPLVPTVLEAMQPFLMEHYGNPSSDHSMGRACQIAVEDAREQVAVMLGAEPDEILFTSGGTESNNLAIRGACLAAGAISDAHVVISSVEHPAVSEVAAQLQHEGCRVTVCPCDRSGVVDVASVADALTERTTLVSVMHANNETGAVQPISEIASLCRRNNVLMHTDAAQTIGKIDANVQALGVSMLSIAGHKFYGPKGIGALYLRKGTPLQRVTAGANHEFGLRPGTENVASIVGLGKASELAPRSLEENSDRLAELRDRLQASLCEKIPEAIVHAGRVERLPNTLSIALPRVSAQQLLRQVPEICASAGAACHSGAEAISATLRAMQVPGSVAAGTIRLTTGWRTSVDDIDWAARTLANAWEALESRDA